MDKLRRALSGNDEPEEESNIITQVDSGFVVMDSTTLSWSTRIKGFIICFLLGIFLSILGSVAMFFANIKGFGILYSLGSVISLASTCFLMGPINQLLKMFAPTRIIATVLVLVSIAMTLFVAFARHNASLVLIFMVIQWLAMVWYSLSYIPYARDAVKKTVESCMA